MNISAHFQIELNPEQQKLVEHLETFMSSNDKVFLLKGFAGTGKTTLIKGLIDALVFENKSFVVCAPTGRAAKVLRNKTGYGQTIHSAIYDFDNLVTINAEKEDVAEHSYHYFFPVIKLEGETIVIVDEASMISSRENKNELFSFGTDILLDDLLTFAQLQQNNRNKMIVIGDPAQLAPVGDNNSWALETSFYAHKKISVKENFLTTVMRQGDNLILENSKIIRNCIDNPSNRDLKFVFDNVSCVDFNNKNVVEKYCDLFPEPNFDNGVIINYSNAQNYWYNQEIRKVYFPNNKGLQVGDLVQVINNNYHKYKTKIYNGEFALIVEVGDTVKKSAPVYVDIKGEKRRKTIELLYRKVKMRLPDFDEDIEAYINETLLESTARDLTIDEMKSVYINAVMRFKEIYPNSEISSEVFKNFLKNDSFYNAIRIKYGYAITGHKSQGGEWQKVFVDYYGRVSLKKDPLRWTYTATTRAIETLYAINYPDFGKFTKLKFSEIGSIGKVPDNAIDFSNVPNSPFHNSSHHKCKSWLYWNVLDKIIDSNFTIENVKSEKYLEKYIFRYSDEIIAAQIYHKQSGFYDSGFNFISGNKKTVEELKILLDAPNQITFQIDYQPSEDFLKELYAIVSATSNDLEINILNVSENLAKYYVTYYFQTDNKVSYIQFWFKGTKEFSTAVVKTYGNFEDKKLIDLIEKINEYATIPTN